MNYEEAAEILEKYDIDKNFVAPPEVLEALYVIMDEVKNNPNNHPAPQTWQDFYAMVDDMFEHAKNNGKGIISADLPTFLCLGWRCQNTGKTWYIKISDMKEQFIAGRNPDKLTPEDIEKKEQLFSKMMMSREGRLAFDEAINNG